MPRVPAVSKPAASVTLGRGAGKSGAKPAPPARSVGQEPQHVKDEDDKAQCPLCIEDLDETDMSFKPCPCGYRMCLFCFQQLKLHCNSTCPNCRRVYGSEEAMEYAKQLEAERAQEASRPKAALAPAPASSSSAGTSATSRASSKPVPTQSNGRRDSAPAARRNSGALDEGAAHGPSPGLPSGVTWASASPGSLSRNQSVEIERPTISMDESSWPSLGAPSGHSHQHPPHQQHPSRSHSAASQQHAQQQQHHHTQQQQQHAQATSNGSTSNTAQQQQQQQQQHRHSPSAASEGVQSYDMSGAGTRRSSSVASSMDRVASSSSLELMSQDPPVTPEQLLQLQHQHQQYQAQHAHGPAGSLSSSSSAFPPMPPPGFEGSSYFGAQVATTVNGMRRAVNVPLSLGNSMVEPYPEAPALLASMQQGVAQGTVSSKEAASQLFALLRQKDQESQAARPRPPGLAATKPPPGFGAPAVQPAAAVAASVASAAAPNTGQFAGIGMAASRPPPPPGFSHLQGSLMQAPPAARAPTQAPVQQSDDSAFGGSAGPIGLNANGTPRTYSLWAGLPGMDLAASTGLTSLWQNLSSSGLSLGGPAQPYNPLGLMDQSMAYASRQSMAAAPKAPPPGFGPYAGAQAGQASQQQQQQLGAGDAVLGAGFRAQHAYQPVGAARYNPLNQPAGMPGAYRPPQLGAGL